MSVTDLQPVAVPGSTQKTTKKTVIISMMAFAVMNVTTILSLRGMPSMAEYGLTSIEPLAKLSALKVVLG